MIEKQIMISEVDPVILFGVNHTHLKLLKSLFPHLRLLVRDNQVRFLGKENEVLAFEQTLEAMQAICKNKNQLTEEDIINCLNSERALKPNVEEIILYTTEGKPIKPRNPNQHQIVEAFQANDLVFATGPAGTGKTFLAIALAVRALKNKQVKRIILCRPAVEAGEKIGFLPGDMKEKIDPYLQPLYDALEEMISAEKLKDFIEHNIIQIAPLAFMRGRTLNDAVVILDEAQNTTPSQIKMFLTRLGMNTKMIVTGDITQIDLPQHQKSGLIEALHILKQIKGISQISLTKKDIVRHPLVNQIVAAYDNSTNH